MNYHCQWEEPANLLATLNQSSCVARACLQAFSPYSFITADLEWVPPLPGTVAVSFSACSRPCITPLAITSRLSLSNCIDIISTFISPDPADCIPPFGCLLQVPHPCPYPEELPLLKLAYCTDSHTALLAVPDTHAHLTNYQHVTAGYVNYA